MNQFQLSSSDIPIAWASLEEFTRWYIKQGLPVLPPADFETFKTDDATAICVFRRPPYQVEIYIIDDPVNVPKHEHPYVEVIQASFKRGPAGALGANVAGLNPLSAKLTLGQAHGAILGTDRDEGNGVLYTFEKWPEGVKPSTVSAVWKGQVVGPKHEALIRRFFPDAFIQDGYADITRSIQ